MTSKGQIHLRDIRGMLKECAPGFVWIEKDHRIHVLWNGKAFRNLPTGAHDSRGLIQRPFVRKLAQQLEILDCAKRQLPGLN